MSCGKSATAQLGFLAMQISAGVLAAFISAALIWLLLRTRLAFKVLDRPNDRSLHATPTPRLGGICVMIAIVGSELAFGAGSLWPIIFAAAGLSIISLADDIWSLPVASRIVLHAIAAGVLLLIYPPTPALLIVPLMIAVVWSINLYNFMDGLDGMAGGMAVFGFGAYALAASSGHSTHLAVSSTIIAGAAAGFLIFNTHPARIFLGDGGSIPLGLLAAFFGYWGFRESIWSWWFPIFAFSPFIADATVTLTRRLLAGEKIWQAHRSHYYQRMAQSEIGHFPTALCWYALMAASAATALLVCRADAAMASVVAAFLVLFYVAAMLLIDRYLNGTTRKNITDGT